jgi:hypothetical protein
VRQCFVTVLMPAMEALVAVKRGADQAAVPASRQGEDEMMVGMA